jgi:hypothetical protein
MALRTILVPAAWKTASNEAVKFDPRSRTRVSGEEVQRQDPLRLRPQELRPPRAVPARSRVDPCVPEDLPHRRRRHPDAGRRQLAVDAAVAPRLILPGQSQHHRPDITAHRRTSGRPRRDSRAQRRRTMPRWHRKIVAGVTISRNPANRSADSAPASRASHARSGHVNRE